MRSNLLAIAAVALVIPSAAAAQSVGSWGGEIGVGTDNRSKAASKTDGRPFVWALAEWSSDDGLFYAGPQFETIRGSDGGRGEITLSAGLRPEVMGFELDLNVARKQRINVQPDADENGWELTADISRSIGPASGRLQVQHAPDAAGATESFTWVAFRAGWAFSPRLEATAEIGRRDQVNSIDYTGWNLGAAYALTDTLELDVRWHDTDADQPGEQYEGALVATLGYAF